MKTKTKTLLQHLLISLTTLFVVVACGGGGGAGVGAVLGNETGGGSGGGGIAGIGGSGIVSSGTVSGFGSVFVNGVEYFTTSTSFEIDGAAGTEANLDIGMRVSVEGEINPDGTTGTATLISYDIDLMGPVSNLSAIDLNVNDGLTRTFDVLGITVQVHKFDTLYKPLAGTVFGFDNTTGALGGLRDKNHLIMNGFFDANGVLHATRVELVSLDFDEAVNAIILTGNITAINNNMLTVTTANSSTIQVDISSADINDLPAGPVLNTSVEVKGLLNTTTNILNATRLRDATSTLEDTDELEVEGIITDFVSNASFKILGFSIDASNAAFTPSSLVLANNVHIEVEGPVVNGILLAEKIEIRGGDASAEVHASITSTSTSPSSNTFVVQPVAGQDGLVITVISTTEFEDDVQEVEPMTFSDLSTMDFVRVRGFENETGGITATRVTRREKDKVIVEGRITAGSAVSNSITILGITFNLGGNSGFEDIDNSPLSQAEFFATGKTVIDKSIVKIEDKETSISGGATNPPDGIADDVELQQP